MKNGLVSVSFRDKTPEEIAAAAGSCGLYYIEWGGDIHLPPGDVKRAEKMAALSEKNGLCPLSYGSYYKLGTGSRFEPVLLTASALGAGIIRIWGGERPSAELSRAERLQLAKEASVCAAMALKQGITVALECHAGTVTDSYESAVDFLKTVGAENFKTYWQPDHRRDIEYNKDAIVALGPYICAVHVFNWDNGRRFPLSAGSKSWRQYLSLLPKAPLLLEFMPNDSLDELSSEAAALDKLRGEQM